MAEEDVKLTEEELEFWFEDEFYAALETWFAADIACCEGCYDDFLKLWPHAYSADNAEFQCSEISLELFYCQR